MPHVISISVQGAGKKLIDEIGNAKRSVKIVSPFLSPFLVKRLIGLHSTGIDVQLITTGTIEYFYGDWERNLHKLIPGDTADGISVLDSMPIITCSGKRTGKVAREITD